jgi:hypothetical protein
LLDLVEGREKRDGDENHDGLLPTAYVDLPVSPMPSVGAGETYLPCGVELQGSQVPPQVGHAGFEVVKGLRDAEVRLVCGPDFGDFAGCRHLRCHQQSSRGRAHRGGDGWIDEKLFVDGGRKIGR